MTTLTCESCGKQNNQAGVWDICSLCTGLAIEVYLGRSRKAVLRRWAWDLPLMQQTVLLSAMRGPDGLPKTNSGKVITRHLRGCVLHNAKEAVGGETDFMVLSQALYTTAANSFFDDWDEYPMHFLMHLFHAAEIVGYKHPVDEVREAWLGFYERACANLHLRPETQKGLDERLCL